MTNGAVTEDLQRESEYTHILGDRLVDRYFRDNIVLTSHLVSFAAFELLKQQNPKLDLYGILRLPPDDFIFDKELLYEVIDHLREALIKMEQEGRIKLSKEIYWENEKLVKDGVRRVGTYHIAKPLTYNKKKEIVSQSFKVLYFYHNRLSNYGLEKEVPALQEKMEIV